MLDRAAILDLPVAELSALRLTTDCLSDHDVALIGFQRTKRISKAARKAWEAGDPAPMLAEVKARRGEIDSRWAEAILDLGQHFCFPIL